MPRNQKTPKQKRQIPMWLLRRRSEKRLFRLIRYCRLVRRIP